jgi:hypothetical protein
MYSQRHGGPYDRGSADAYYRRPFNPHYYDGATGQGPQRVAKVGSPEYDAYKAGFYDQDDSGDYKDWR